MPQFADKMANAKPSAVVKVSEKVKKITDFKDSKKEEPVSLQHTSESKK